ncbi:hypothetical protein D3C72_1772110 [compost metagenome]
MVTIGHEHRLRDDRKIIRRTQSRTPDRLELGISGLQGDGLVTVSRALFQAREVLFCRALAIRCAGKK